MKQIDVIKNLLACPQAERTMWYFDAERPNERPNGVGEILCGSLENGVCYLVEFSATPTLRAIPEVMGRTNNRSGFWWAYRIE